MVESFKKFGFSNTKGSHLQSDLSIDDMWKKIEEYGIDRKLLESTNPSSELLYQLYTAIVKVNEQVNAINNKNISKS